MRRPLPLRNIQNHDGVFMLPQSHVTYTLAIWNLAEKRFPGLKNADYRLVALAAMGPDLIDKPLAAIYFYRKYKSAVLFAHTLIVHAAVFAVAIFKKPRGWQYLLAFNGHAILDRLWTFHQTWYWPLKGWRFQTWGKQGSEQTDIKRAYWYAFTRRPELWGWEAGGLLAGLWFVMRNRLYRWPRLKTLLFTGKIPPAD